MSYILPLSFHFLCGEVSKKTHKFIQARDLFVKLEQDQVA